MFVTHLNSQQVWKWATLGTSRLWRVGLILGLAVAVGLPVSVSVVDAMPFYVQGSFSAGVQPYNSQVPQQNGYNTGLLPQTSVSGGTNNALYDSAGGTDESVTGTAAMGSIITGGAVNTFTLPSAFSPPKGFIQSGGTWFDTFTVTSASLAPGTYVDFQLTQTVMTDMLSAGIFNGGYVQAQATFNGINIDVNNNYAPLIANFNTQSDAFGNQVGNCFGVCVGSSSQVVHISVGSTFNISGSMLLSAHTQTAGTIGIGQTNALTFLDPLTPGVSYTTASGMNYVSPVPVPPTVLLFGSGLSGLLGLVAWQRKRLSKAALYPYHHG